MEQRLACLLDAVTSADPAAVVPDAVAGRVVECLSAEIGHCLPVFGGETCFRELLPLQKSCARCDSHLAKIASAKAVATIVHTGGLVRKDHIPCRCRNKNCDMYGSLIWRNYFVDAGRHFFLGHPQDLKCFMVSSSFGFSIEWLEDFHSRVVRQHASFISESDVIQQRAVRHGQTAWLPVARLRKMISEAWFKWRLLVRGYAYNIPGVAQNPIDIHQGVEDLLKPVLPALQKAFSDAAVASARSANMRRDVIVMDGNAKNRVLDSHVRQKTQTFLNQMSVEQDFTHDESTVHTIKDIALGEDAASPNPQPQPAEVQPDFDALVGADPLPFPGGDFADSIVDDAAASHSPELPPETEPLRVADVRSIEFGYGPDGASVQSAFHSKHLTDRFIMKATLLHGHPKVTSKTICDKLRSSRESGRKALPREDWVAVMEACAGSPILDFQDDTLQLRAIPQDAPGRTFYHNELMKLCGVTMRELMTAMNRAAAAKAKSAAPPKRKRQDGHED
ncbi:Uncharacterized protein SCF082_LOCUS38904 [Durusdinium trenchii]|uniref:Uncharacterized protein n=1 Tax=Durusdinium trenchii TaxID=1381693 RepID=A0ABP0Q0I7_9DINO